MMKLNSFFYFSLARSFVLLCCGLSLLSQNASAQTAPVQYQAIQLNDQQSEYSLDGKIYVLKDTGTPLTVETVERLIQSGSIIQSRTNGALHLNLKTKGTWIVIPIVNNSKNDVWSLNFGNIMNGRISTLKDITLYNMNTKQYAIQTQGIFERNKNITSPLTFRVPSGQTSFFILNLKPNLMVPSFLNLTLQDTNQNRLSDFLGAWLLILLTFSGGVYFIKSAKDTLSLSDVFLSCMCFSLSFAFLINNKFIYFNKLDMELAYPVVWVITSQSLMLAFITVKKYRDELPVSILGGLVSAALIINLVGFVILKSMPDIAIYLLYGPVLGLFLVIMGTIWGTPISQKRHAYTHISNTSFFLFMLLVWIILMDFELIPALPITLLVPAALLIGAIVAAITGRSPEQQVSMVYTEAVEDVFAINQVGKKDILMIHEAKEKSEHHRLMQVIEQERKLMSDLQVKSAQQTEDMRKAKEAADEANRAKSAFLAVVSHEIRTPMTGIMGMLRMLQDTQLSKDQKEYTSTIKDSGDAMLALLNDILDFEKIESGKMDLENINFDLKRLVRSVHTLMRGHAEAKNVTLELELDPQVPTWVYGDPTRLRQVLLNLINNAIKFTSKGSVYLRIRDLTGEASGANQKIHQIYFAVQDSGIGIGTASQKKLFMPFAQADTSISRKYGGTGLGLAICKRLIEAMGGAISISSKEGEGSTFFFTISMYEGSEILEETNESLYQNEGASGQTLELKNDLTILIVDDNGINQKVISGFVNKLGAKTMTAGSGAEALDLHARYSFDAILLDIELPDMNGIDVAKAIRALSIPSKASIPIIALTGNTQDEDVANYLAAGMNDHAGKPVTYEKIGEILGKIDTRIYSAVPVAKEAVIDFSDDDEDAEEESPRNEISPLAAYGAQLNGYVPMPQPAADQPSHFADEEDSFENAVKQFESLENQSKIGFDTPHISGSLSEAGLDESILGSLKSGLSTEQIQEILVSFYEKADELIAEIGKSYLSQDKINLNARAHELKGMAGNFGFSEVSQMCGIIEKAAKENNLEAAKSSIEHLGDKYAVSRTYLSNWLSQ